MRLSEFESHIKVHRDTWRPGLYAIRRSGSWVYMERTWVVGQQPGTGQYTGQFAGYLSNNMLEYSDYELYEKQEKQEKVMENVNVNFVGKNFNVVSVVYQGQNNLHAHIYKISQKLIIAERDLVVVQNEKGLALARVVNVYPDEPDNELVFMKARAWVVDTVDESEQLKRIKNTEKKRKILKQLEVRKAALEANAEFELLAATDPKAKKLLKQLKALS